MRFTKIIALTLASAITLTTLTSCANSEVKQVEDKPFTVDDRNGTYTGEWRGRRPNGNGELLINADEYYRGEWNNGVLLGQGEIRKTFDDGSWEYYNGECADNAPAGEGQLILGSSNDSCKIEIDGDFSDESTLIYYATDNVGKLVDIGGIENGEYVSYVCNDDFEGIEIEDWMHSTIDSVGILNGYTGKYIGQTDENGVPNGYGYSVCEQYNTHMYKLGTWKDGRIDGDYSEWKYGNYWETRIGTMKDGRDVGDFTVGKECQSYYLVTKNNCETSFTYELCNDGRYRTGYTTREVHYYDGRYEYQKYTTVRDDLNGWKYYYEGEYALSDADGNVIECGIADLSSECTLKWLSYEQALNNKLWEKLAPVVAAGVVIGIGAYALGGWSNDFESSSAGKMLAQTREDMAVEYAQRDLLEEADREEENGHKEEAKRLREKADSLYWR